MHGMKHVVLIPSLIAVLLARAWDLGAEETHPALQAAAKRAAIRPTTASGHQGPAPMVSRAAAVSASHQAAALPPTPPGVTDLKFSELFKPIGPRGLEYSDKLRALDGKKVRLLGYMVRQTEPVPWTFLLSPVPVTLHEKEYGLAEDMPATIVHVTTQRNATPLVPFTPGLLLLTGTLSIGNREEAGGRNSSVRLALDPPTPEQRAALNQLARGPTAAPKPPIASLSTNAVPK